LEYAETAGWIRNRSPENYISMLTLADTIWKALQHSIVKFADKASQSEFENIEIVIDRNFIKAGDPLRHWGEWLRNAIYDSSRRAPLITLRGWGSDHPFNRKYRQSTGPR